MVPSHANPGREERVVPGTRERQLSQSEENSSTTTHGTTARMLGSGLDVMARFFRQSRVRAHENIGRHKGADRGGGLLTEGDRAGPLIARYVSDMSPR